MKDMVKIVAVLTVVCLVCGFALSFVYSTAQEKIQANAVKAKQDAIAILAPDAAKIEEIVSGEDAVYKLLDDAGQVAGYAFLASGQGYQGKIKIMAVINADLEKLEGIEVIESLETPGLGARINEDFFKKQFKGLAVAPELTYTKDEPSGDNQIQAITGATVSSKAVVVILNNRIKQLGKFVGPAPIESGGE